MVYVEFQGIHIGDFIIDPVAKVKATQEQKDLEATIHALIEEGERDGMVIVVALINTMVAKILSCPNRATKMLAAALVCLAMASNFPEVSVIEVTAGRPTTETIQ